ncbi:MAG: cytoplasmic protein [Deltaproteobacteria bacterium]|nr:cytoplasmic protein [Deltaproteobacteria bacterium]
MLQKDLILRNPLQLLSRRSEDQLQAGQFGAVLARAGVGKTAFLVQVALNSLLRDQNVLHISLDDPVHKVSLWYKEVFRLIADQYETSPTSDVWQNLLPHRFIMTFKVEGFSVPKLKERLTDLTSQEIFRPDMIIIDGLPFDLSTRDVLMEIKAHAKSMAVPLWLTVLTHRHEKAGSDGLPVQLDSTSDLFEAIIQLQPKADKVHIRALKPASEQSLLLDPQTLLIKDL